MFLYKVRVAVDLLVIIPLLVYFTVLEIADSVDTIFLGLLVVLGEIGIFFLILVRSRVEDEEPEDDPWLSYLKSRND